MDNKTKLIALSLVATSAPGCYATWDIAPESVVRLDGFRAGETRHIWPYDEEVSQIPFTSDTRLRFRGSDGAQAEGVFRAIDVSGKVFTGVERENGAMIVLDLSRMTSIEARQYSLSKTLGLSLGLGLGVPVFTTLTTILVVLATTPSGRPLRRAAEEAPTRALLSVSRGSRRPSSRPRGSVNKATEERLFTHWAAEASAECASIPAFLALARDLRLASAPSALVRGALRAASEEASHTALCTALANEFAPSPISARIPEVSPNTDADQQTLLKRLALESFWDGCVAEGAAAAAARRGIGAARDEATVQALNTIARDEQGHADLSRAIVAFCLSVGGRSVRDALAESLVLRRSAEEARLNHRFGAPTPFEADFDERIAEARGLPSIKTTRAAQIEAWETQAGEGKARNCGF